MTEPLDNMIEQLDRLKQSVNTMLPLAKQSLARALDCVRTGDYRALDHIRDASALVDGILRNARAVDQAAVYEYLETVAVDLLRINSDAAETAARIAARIRPKGNG